MWVNADEIAERLKLPKSFDTSIIDIDDVVDEWLADLLTPAQFASLNAWVTARLDTDLPEEETPSVDPATDAFNAALYEFVKPFLIYAAWADYVHVGDLIPTETGLVEKERDDSDAISDERRAETYRFYKNKALRRAVKITDYLTSVARACAAPESVGGLQIGKAKGRTESVFQ